MAKTLLEMVEELNRKPVSDRPSIPLAKNHTGNHEATAGDDEDDNKSGHRQNFNRLLSAAVRSPKSSG